MVVVVTEYVSFRSVPLVALFTIGWRVVLLYVYVNHTHTIRYFVILAVDFFCESIQLMFYSDFTYYYLICMWLFMFTHPACKSQIYLVIAIHYVWLC